MALELMKEGRDGAWGLGKRLGGNQEDFVGGCGEPNPSPTCPSESRVVSQGQRECFD